MALTAESSGYQAACFCGAKRDSRHGVSGGDPAGRSATKTAAFAAAEIRSWRHWVRFKLFILLGSLLVTQSGLAKAQEGVAERGRVFFQRQCGVCHQAAQPRNGLGPTLEGVIGRAGTVEGFNYSPALKSSGISWTPETLDSFLANPTTTVRGTRMAQRVPDEQQRRDIIKFLAAPGCVGAKGRSVRSQPPFP
jgi:cytochrome c